MSDFYQKLRRLFIKIGLSEKESKMLTAAFVSPGLSVLQLGKQCGFKRMMTYRIFEKLSEQQYLKVLIDPQTKKRVVYPCSLQNIARNVDKQCRDLRFFASELLDIHELMKNPIRSHDLQIDKYFGDEAKEIFFDVHHFDWDHMVAIGDFDSYVNAVGYDYERSWIQERVKKTRSADAVISSTGDWTQEIIKTSEDDLRKTVIAPHLVENRFISIFPEYDTTVIFTGNKTDDGLQRGSCIKIVSRDLASIYTSFADQFLG